MARSMKRTPKAAVKASKGRKMPSKGRGRAAPRKPTTSRRKGY